MLEIPYQQLSEDALNGLIEEFINREGTDYGAQEYSLSAKVSQILAQIKQGDILIAYDEESESCTLVSKGQYSVST